MKTTLTHKTFEQWKKDNPQLEDADAECFECEGSGEHMCTCGDMHVCGECSGTGKTQSEVMLEVLYRSQYDLDKKRLEKWKTVMA
jgi:hypothetical protein